MDCFINGKKVDWAKYIASEKMPEKAVEKPLQKSKNRVVFASYEQKEQAFAWMGLPDDPAGAQQATHFESRHNEDCIYLNMPDIYDVMGKRRHAALYLSAAGLLVLHADAPQARQLVSELEAWEGEFPLPGRVQVLFLTRITAGDAEVLADMEEEVLALEERLLAKKNEDYVAQISQLRKRLIALHRYYERLFEALEDMEENENGLLSKAQLKYLHAQTNRAGRLESTVSHLSDYVTQVREAYQNQLDISLNETMKLFTVITAIFLPLTLIAGWYGMNLQMPEYAIAAAYPIVIVVSLVVAVASIWYFRRHKWF